MRMFLFWICIAIAIPLPSIAQNIHIRVVNGKNGKAVTDECLNIAFGDWHHQLLVPTDLRGVVTLHLSGKSVTADVGSRSTCNQSAFLGPTAVVSADGFTVMSDWYVACQEFTRGANDSSGSGNSLGLPSYSVSEIVSRGISASNTCGKVRLQPQKGELIFYVRPRSLKEKLEL